MASEAVRRAKQPRRICLKKSGVSMKFQSSHEFQKAKTVMVIPKNHFLQLARRRYLTSEPCFSCNQELKGQNAKRFLLSLKGPGQSDGRRTEAKVDHGVEDRLELVDLVPQPDEVEADDRLVLRDHLQWVQLRPSQPLHSKSMERFKFSDFKAMKWLQPRILTRPGDSRNLFLCARHITNEYRKYNNTGGRSSVCCI